MEIDTALYSVLKAFQLVSDKTIEEKVKTLAQKHNDLYFFYLPKKIYFEKDLCKHMDDIILSARDIFIDITTFPINPEDTEYNFNRELLLERHEYWEKARNAHKDEIMPLMEKLEDRFRNILGINA